MKRLILTGLILMAVNLGNRAQGVPNAQNLQPAIPTRMPPAKQEELPRFDLDFLGGTPEELVRAIQGRIKVLNAVIPEELKDEKLPPLSLRNVNVEELFKALEFASHKQLPHSYGVPDQADPMGRGFRHISTTRSGFRSLGPITPNSIWYFYVEKPVSQAPLRMVRYYQLSPFLEQFKIDDISTAIQAGWNMLGDKETPQLNFHEDTKLLIAVGEPKHLDMIADALKELGQGMVHTHNEKVKAAPAKTESAPKKF